MWEKNDGKKLEASRTNVFEFSIIILNILKFNIIKYTQKFFFHFSSFYNVMNPAALLNLVRDGNREEIFSAMEKQPHFSSKFLADLVCVSGNAKDIEFFAMYLVDNKGVLPDENALYAAAVYKYSNLIDYFIENKADLAKALHFCYTTRNTSAFELLLSRVSILMMRI